MMPISTISEFEKRLATLAWDDQSAVRTLWKNGHLADDIDLIERPTEDTPPAVDSVAASIKAPKS